MTTDHATDAQLLDPAAVRAAVAELVPGERQQQIAVLAALGWSSSRIGAALGIQEQSVRKRLSETYDTLDVPSGYSPRVDLAARVWAVVLGQVLACSATQARDLIEEPLAALAGVVASADRPVAPALVALRSAEDAN